MDVNYLLANFVSNKYKIITGFYLIMYDDFIGWAEIKQIKGFGHYNNYGSNFLFIGCAALFNQ